ncbi:MAG TPA: hypothetical protein VJ767_11225 [Nitrososphaeraceae archaeon]|nr:hypothetical protein [Nitrososphaeraceae archaeon]
MILTRNPNSGLPASPRKVSIIEHHDMINKSSAPENILEALIRH